MERKIARVEEPLILVAVETGTLGFWFYFGFYASPAMLAELESRMN